MDMVIRCGDDAMMLRSDVCGVHLGMGMGKVILDTNEFWNTWNKKMNGI